MAQAVHQNDQEVVAVATKIICPHCKNCVIGTRTISTVVTSDAKCIGRAKIRCRRCRRWSTHEPLAVGSGIE